MIKKETRTIAEIEDNSLDLNTTTSSSITDSEVCADAAGELKSHGTGIDEAFLCHFSDGTFCEIGLLADSECKLGQWPFPGSAGGDVFGPGEK